MIIKLSNIFKYSISKCVNDTDMYTFTKLVDIDSKFLLTYRDSDTYIYGYDIRTFNQFINNNPDKIDNPYTGKPIDVKIINKIKKYIKYSKLNGLDMVYPIDEDEVNQSQYQIIKSRVIKVFQEILTQKKNLTFMLLQLLIFLLFL